MKPLALTAILWLTAAPAAAQLCGPDVQHSVTTVKVRSQLEVSPPKDRALLFVFDTASRAGTFSSVEYQIKIASDHDWIGVLRNHTYFVVELAPGHHALCLKMANDVQFADLDAEAGRSYYFQAGPQPYAPPYLRRVDDADAAVLLKKCRRAIFWEKDGPKPAGASR